MTYNVLQMVSHQLENFFGLSQKEASVLKEITSLATSRCQYSFERIANKYYQQGCSEIDPLHSSQYAMFLYFLSKEALKYTAMASLADKIYYLNKSLNNCEFYHGVDLPDIMYFDHPLGSILGKAQYSDYFSFQQGCCVGNNHGFYPTLGKHVHMFANSTIIGKSNIGSRVLISANSFIKDQDVPDNSIVFGSSPNLKIVTKSNSYFKEKSPFILDTSGKP